VAVTGIILAREGAGGWKMISAARVRKNFEQKEAAPLGAAIEGK